MDVSKLGTWSIQKCEEVSSEGFMMLHVSICFYVFPYVPMRYKRRFPFGMDARSSSVLHGTKLRMFGTRVSTWGVDTTGS